MKLLLLLKSTMTQLGLFDEPVHVEGHVRKDGVIVKPHTARRKKRTKEPAPQARDKKRTETLIDRPQPKKPDDQVGAAAQAASRMTEPEYLAAGHGEIIGYEVAVEAARDRGLIPPVDRESGRRAALKELAEIGEKLDLPSKEVWAKMAAKPGSAQFGVPAGTSKAERKRLNARAVELLQSKQDGFTVEEQAELARYTGRGGIGDSLNEFYTAPEVASAMWSALTNLGFRGGSVLEPCAGTGVFLHTAPSDTKVTGVELDPTSARIAGALHGERHEVHEMPSEQLAREDVRLFDAVIGNVPFGLRGSLIKEDKPNLKTAEQYFVDTAIDKAKAGGVVALIVPTGIMDGTNTRGFRERILRKAEFLGAHRLPNTAFEAAHTEVTTDILFFRRRSPDVAGALGAVERETLKKLGIWDDEFLAGKYFSGRGKANVYGTPEAGWRTKAGMGQDFTVTGSMEGVPETLAGFQGEPAPAPVTVADVTKALEGDEAATRKAVSGALKRPYEVAVPGDTKLIDGVTYVLQGDPPRWHRADGEDGEPASVKDARELAQGLDTLFRWRQRDDVDQDASGVRGHRKAVIEALDEYVATHGSPAQNKDLARAAQQDKALWRLIGAVNRDGSYSDLVTGNVSGVDATSFSAVATRLALEHGGFAADELADAWKGGDRAAAIDHLFASADFALDADGRTWTNLDNYLSGELWPKLDAAKAAVEHEGLDEAYRRKYQHQIDELERMIDPRALDDVEINLNSAWVPLPVVMAFFRSRQEAAGGWYAAQDPPRIAFGDGVYTVEGNAPWLALYTKYVNRAGVKKDDQDTIAEMNRTFKEWLCGSVYRDKIEDLYNRNFRGFIAKTYSDAPLDIPGLNPAFSVNAYHFSGLRWALEAGKGIIGDDVGLGKTGRALMLARLAKVNGTARKPTIVVPKSVLANWIAEVEAWFPGSKVLVIGETYTRDKNGKLTSKTDNKTERDRKLHDLSQNEYDFVLMSQPAFNDIDLDPENKGKYINDDFWVQRGDSLGQAGDKRIKKIREAYEQATASRDFQKRTDVTYWNDLGVDMLLLDEAHAFKNLYAARARFGGQPKFLGGQGLSNRALDANLKSRWVREHNDGKGVYGLTATPTKNSPLEIYSMLSHIAPEAFERIGIRNSEEFLDRFCEFKNETVLGVDGEIEEALVTAGFKNLDELREIMTRYINRRTAVDVGLKIPEKQERQHLVDMSQMQQAVYHTLREQAAESGDKDATGEAHIFSIMSRMGKASLDLEMLGEQHKGERSPKIEAVAAEAAKGAKDGGQVVFCDHIGAHEKIAAAMVKAGIPRDQIGIINAQVAASSADRQNISDAFNAGKLKVVIGNTATMGEGVNLQNGTTDIHHMDLPWDPASLQQRNGRGVRQGNRNEAVRIHSYLAKGSFDGYRYQTMMAKRDWQDALWHGGDRVENLAREGSLSREDMLIMLSADPDTARAKFASDKTAALERLAVQRRSEAGASFVRFQKMKRSYASLKNKGTLSAARLKTKLEQARTALAGDRYFQAKNALDVDAPVLIQPETGIAWHAGSAFEMAPGDGSPIVWSDDKTSRWVVTKVDEGGGIVSARPYGRPGAAGFSITLDKMARGVTPVEYDAEAELAHSADAIGDSDVASAKSPTDLIQFHPEAINKHYDRIQAQIKGAFREYKDGWKGDHVPLIDPDGKAVAVASYDARKKLDTHDIMLPLPAHREKAIEAWIEAETAKKIETRYHERGGRRGGGADYSRPTGVKVYYPGFRDRNGWDGAAAALFGDGFREDARAEFERRATAKAREATDLKGAFEAIVPTLTVNGLRAKWSRGALTTLWAKARADGALDKTLREVLSRNLSAHAFYAPSTSRPGDLLVRAALINTALASGHADVAATFVVDQATDAGWPAAKTIAALTRLRVPRQSYAGDTHVHEQYDPAVIEAMQHVVERGKVGDRTVGEVAQEAGAGHSIDPLFDVRNRNRPIGDVLTDLRGEKEAA